MKINIIFKKLMGGVRFSVVSALFFVIGVGVSLVFYNVYASHTWQVASRPSAVTNNYLSAGNAGTTLSSSAWNNLVQNDESFYNRIYQNEHDIASINTDLGTKASNTKVNSLVNCGWEGVWYIADDIGGNDFGIICKAGQVIGFCAYNGISNWNGTDGDLGTVHTAPFWGINTSIQYTCS